MSEHSQSWDERDKAQVDSQIYGPDYGKFGKQPCRCSACGHRFVYECTNARCNCCATG